MIRPEKQESRRIRVAINRVLWEVWDPIGVNDEPMSRDEYLSYVGDVYEFLIGDAADGEIAEYLNRVAEDRMGLNRADVKATVMALRSIPLN